MLEGILVSIFAVACYVAGREYTGKHLITYFPEVGWDALRGEEEARLEEEHVRDVLGEEEIKKAA